MSNAGGPFSFIIVRSISESDVWWVSTPWLDATFGVRVGNVGVVQAKTSDQHRKIIEKVLAHAKKRKQVQT